jgi:hypothetical protein
MSLWLEVFCQNHLDEISPEALSTGIAKRLATLTYLYCPDDEEEPDVVLKRLRIRTDPTLPDVFFIHARWEPERFIRMDRCRASTAREDVKEKLERLNRLPNQEDPDLKRVLQFLNATKESVALELKYSDTQTMGWPVAVAAAAWIAEIGSGMIRSEDGEWMISTAHEIAYIFDEQQHV